MEKEPVSLPSPESESLQFKMLILTCFILTQIQSLNRYIFCIALLNLYLVVYYLIYKVLNLI